MARSDLLIALFQASIEGDREAFRKAAEELIAEERGKQHHILADKLHSVLKQRPKRSFMLNGAFGSIDDKAKDFISEIYPKLELSQISLNQENASAINDLLEEHFRADLLKSYNMAPRHRVMLYGPPGNGKTSLAEGIAEALSLPMYVLRYDSVIGSYLGETASRLRRVFDYCRTTPCVLFLDEFDALGKERGDTHDTGEIKRVVSSLLTQIDDLPSYVIIIAASNHPELLDRAVWRRFELRLKLENPSDDEIRDWVAKYAATMGQSVTSRLLDAISKQCSGLSYSEIKTKLLSAQRRFILKMPNIDFPTAVKMELGIK